MLRFPEEMRAAAASYSAQEFNLLNDLNNLTIGGRKLNEEEKRQIVETIKNSQRVNVEKSYVRYPEKMQRQ